MGDRYFSDGQQHCRVSVSVRNMSQFSGDASGEATTFSAAKRQFTNTPGSDNVLADAISRSVLLPAFSVQSLLPPSGANMS